MTSTQCKCDENRREHGHGRPTNAPGTPATAAVEEEEVRVLVDRLPPCDRALVRAMFGFDGRPARHGAELRKEFKLTNAQIKEAMQRSLRTLWFVHLIDELPAIRALAGENQAGWPARVWEHTDHILHPEIRTRYAQLLLVIAGTPAHEVEARLGDHLRELRAREREAKHRQHLQQEARDRARLEITKLLDHTIWPDNPREFKDLSGYRITRPINAGTGQSGYFLSHKLHRFVQYDSGLERRVLQALDNDGRIRAYQEQPLKLRFTIDGRPTNYHPDAIIQLYDDRLIVVELKPEHRLGYLRNWLRFHALWDWCCHNGVGMLIGSPRTTILEFYRQAEETPLRSELKDAVAEGPLDQARYLQFKKAHGASMRDIARAVTALQLDWQPEPLHITRPSPESQTAARALWNTVALASIGLETQPV